MRRFNAPIFAIPLLALLAGCVVNPAPVNENTADGLVRVTGGRADEVYARPGAALGHYRRVMLDSVELAFKPDWQKRHPEVTADEVTRIRSQGAGVFREIFGFALSTHGGYGLATQPASDVLRVSATISDLDVAAAAGTSRMYVVSPSDLTMILELRDSQSGALLVRALDRERGRQAGDLRVEDAVSNSVEARKALEMWAGLLRAALDEARGTPQEAP